MYAVFKNGGKQYLIKKGQIINIEKINLKVGNYFFLNNILMINNYSKIYIGYPFILGVKIIAKVLSHNRKKKILILKFRRRKHSKKLMGHRQYYSSIKIIDIKIKV